LHVQPLPHATALLDSGSMKKISKGTIRTPEDYIKSAYQRCHLNAVTAMQTITQLPDNKPGIIMLCLTFGGAPCLFEWNILSESICDLANKMLFDKNLDPLTTYAPSKHLVPAMKLLDASIPFAEGADLIVDIPVDPRGTGDVYIDDLIKAIVVIDGTDNTIHCEQATLLAIDTCVHPKHPNEPIPREDMEARKKTSGRSRIEGAKNRPGMASGHTVSPHPTTKEQVRGLDKSDQSGHPARDNDRQGS
jgi:hypothetical protein